MNGAQDPNEDDLAQIRKTPVFYRESGEPAKLFEEPRQEPKLEAQMLPGVPIRPYGARILVRQNKYTERRLIVTPDKYQVPPTTGMVVAIGPDVPKGLVWLEEPVLFGLYSGIPMKIVGEDGEEMIFLSMQIEDIAGELLVDPDKVKSLK